MDNAKDIKERILDEASKMFLHQGIKSVRMDDIALACGISKRTLYELFADREELIRNCMDYHAAQYEVMLNKKTAGAANVIEEFWIIFNNAPNLRGNNRQYMLDLMKFYPKLFEEFIRNHHARLIRHNRERLEEGIRQGLFLSMIDTEHTSRNLTCFIYGLHRDPDSMVMSEKIDDHQFDPRSMQITIMLFFRGITTEKGRRYIDEHILAGIK